MLKRRCGGMHGDKPCGHAGEPIVFGRHDGRGELLSGLFCLIHETEIGEIIDPNGPRYQWMTTRGKFRSERRKARSENG